MKEIHNRTRRPLRVPLPQGKVLHLGPLQVAEVAPNAVEHPPFLELVHNGLIEILGEGDHDLPHARSEAAHHTRGIGRSPDTHLITGNR